MFVALSVVGVCLFRVVPFLSESGSVGFDYCKVFASGFCFVLRRQSPPRALDS